MTTEKSEPRETIRFMVDFAGWDLQKPRMRERAEAGWRGVFRGEFSPTTRGRFLVSNSTISKQITKEDLAHLQTTINQFMFFLTNGQGWCSLGVDMKELHLTVIGARDWTEVWAKRGSTAKGIRPTGPMMVLLAGPVTAVGDYMFLRLLEDIGVDRLRTCGSRVRGKVCGRAFVKVRRQEYCSTKCQQRENQRRWRTNEVKTPVPGIVPKEQREASNANQRQPTKRTAKGPRGRNKVRLLQTASGT